jgi:methionine-rich copper-binding protein CopC
MKRIGLVWLVTSVFSVTATTALAAPTVTWTIPVATTNVSEGTTVVATIDDQLKASTVTTSNFFLRRAAIGTPTSPTNCSSGTLVTYPVTYTSYVPGPPKVSTVTLAPSANLESYTGYRACITTGMQNFGGTAVTASSYAFTTRDYIAPTVTGVVPTPDGKSLNAYKPTISITFSEAMNTSTFNSTSTFILTTDGGATQISGTLQWSNGNKTCTFVPDSNLQDYYTYTATVSGIVTDVAGNSLGSDRTWFFSIDTITPAVLNYSPFPNNTYVNAAKPTITITFNEPVDPTGLTGLNPSKITVKKGTTSITTYSGTTTDNTTFTFTTSSNLAEGTYTVSIIGGSSGVKDAAGNYSTPNPMTGTPFNFIVDLTAPTVSAISPVNGATNVSITSPVTVTFTENNGMNASSINTDSFTVTSATGKEVGTMSYSSTTKTATFTPGGGLAFGTTYTVTLTSAVKDVAGNSLASTPYTWTFTTQPIVMSNYSIIPPFITAPVTPNVLIILDNSNSMDEDMQGNAIGSPKCSDYSDPNTCSRSIMARKALIDIVNKYANKIRLGLMTYKLPSSSKYELHNAFYFTSYDLKSYCPNPPAACYNYCVNEDPQTGSYTPSADETACSSACLDQNSLFDVTYRDKILTAAGTSGSNGTAIGGDKRKNYCSILHPKTMSYTHASGETLYHNLAGTFYSSSDNGKRYLYSTGYSSSETNPTVSYSVYTGKTGSSDGNSGYTGSSGSSAFTLTDDDWGLGFFNIGQRWFWDHSSKTWFANSSPGSGYLHVVAQENVSGNVQLDALLAKLRGDTTPYAFQNDETGYMSCTNTSNPNQCTYIVNAGLTPTAGTLKSAQDYLNGVLSTSNGGPSANPKTPIQYTCQKNFIIYVTDGLPSVNESGTKGSADTLLPGVLTRIDELRCPASSTSANCKVVNGTNKYDVKTFVLGVALANQSKSTLDQMAVHGGTDVSGHAYYANNATELSSALSNIFESILTNVSAGSAASIVNNRGQSGANIITAVFYPLKDFSSGTEKASWIGDLQNYWYYFDPYISNSTIREDTDENDELNLVADDKIDIAFNTTTGTTEAKRYKDDGKGNYTKDPDPNNTVELDSLKALWRAGKLLYERDVTANPRKIYITVDGSTFVKSNGAFLETDTTGLVDVIKPFLDVGGSSTEAVRIIKYMRGIDDPADSTLRNRTVHYGTTTTDPAKGVGVWKLGDIINSTPKIQSDKPLSGYHLDYGDTTYDDFINSDDYTNRGMVYVGANDGMLHAFRLGKITPLYTNLDKARLTNPGSTPPALGSEVWAFMPKNVLPFLKYYLEPSYNHLFYVDNTALLVDASISKPTACALGTDYWDCERKTEYSSGKVLDSSKTSWRTILLGGMGYGGSSRPADGDCNTISGTLPDTLLNCVKAPMNTVGYTHTGLSSYFALDVSTPDSPSLLWSFSNPSLGYTISEPVIVRINGKKGGAGADQNDRDSTKNGRWFAVFASGPTGPIETTTHQFYGRSDQNMKIFVVDLKTGALEATFDSGIPNSFGGSLSTNAIDVDKDNKYSMSRYSTDVVYIGYVKPKDVSGVKQWVDGGLMRLVIPYNDPLKDPTDPTKWTLSTVIDGVGPITASIDKLFDSRDKFTNNPVLWLYFGGGRYFFKNSTAGIDSADDGMSLYGIKDPCYTAAKVFNPTCTTALTKSTLTNQTSDTKSDYTLASGYRDGWYIDLDASSPSSCTTNCYKAERVITTPSAKTNGQVQFTTFKPTADICGFGGETFFWPVNYATGAAPAQGTLQGKVILQLSTGAIVVIDLSKAKSGGSIAMARGGRQIDVGAGKPPAPKPPSDSLKKPVKKVLQIQER